jgi:VWFA-related protein
MKKHILFGLAALIALSACPLQAQQPTQPAPQQPAPQQPAQQPPPAQNATPPPPTPDDAGPQNDNGSIILPTKKDQPPPPPAPAEEKLANPAGETYSLRVDVPLVNMDVSVLLDSTHEFVPNLKSGNFLVVEDGVAQEVQSLRLTKTPITAVLLLEFAATSYSFLHDMQNASSTFFRSMQPEDYVAVATFDLRSHILTDFTNNKDTIREALQSLTMPTFRETNEFDALYDTLDRLTRIDGRKYVILISSGRDSMSRLTLDQMLAKIKATPNVTIFTIGTGGFAQEMGRPQRGGSVVDYLQADNEMKTFAEMTGGMHFKPVFEGELPDIFTQINESIRNQYVLTYKPTNSKNDGTFRKVKIYLVDNEGMPLKMRDEKGHPLKYSVVARDGYRAKLPVQ